MACTQATAAARVVAAFGGTAWQGLATYYLELVSGTCNATTAGDASTLGRIPVTDEDFDDNGDGTAESNGILTWDAPGTDLDEQSYIEFWSASSGGTRYFYEELASPVTPLAGQPVSIPAGQLIWNEL